MKVVISLAVISALTACATSAPLGEKEPLRRAPQGECDAATVQTHIGKTATQALGTRLLADSGADVLRWVPPRSAVTMDYRPDRLTVSYNDDMVVTSIKCA